MFNIAGMDFAPGGFGIVVTARARAFQIGSASSAIETAISDQVFVLNDGFLFHVLYS